MLRRLEIHHTPKHASWLNMAEIEIGVLRSQRLDRRTDNKGQITTEIAAWETAPQRRKGPRQAPQSLPRHRVIISVARYSFRE
jgi:hypothetical protein